MYLPYLYAARIVSAMNATDTTQPGQVEKMTEQFLVKCKPSEKRKWLALFGYMELSRTVRTLLAAHARRIEARRSSIVTYRDK